MAATVVIVLLVFNRQVAKRHSLRGSESNGIRPPASTELARSLSNCILRKNRSRVLYSSALWRLRKHRRAARACKHSWPAATERTIGGYPSHAHEAGNNQERGEVSFGRCTSAIHGLLERRIGAQATKLAGQVGWGRRSHFRPRPRYDHRTSRDRWWKRCAEIL